MAERSTQEVLVADGGVWCPAVSDDLMGVTQGRDYEAGHRGSGTLLWNVLVDTLKGDFLDEEKTYVDS